MRKALLATCFLLVLAGTAAATCVAVVTGLQSLKWLAIGILVPGVGTAAALIGGAYTVAGVAAAVGGVDPPLTAPPRIERVERFLGRELVTTVAPGDVLRIVGSSPAEFEFTPSDNLVRFGKAIALGPVPHLSTQRVLVVAVPPDARDGDRSLTVTTREGDSAPYALTIGPRTQPATDHAAAAGAPGAVAFAFGQASRDWFTAFESLANTCPQLQGQQLPDFVAVQQAHDDYFLFLSGASTGDLTTIDNEILAGPDDIIGLTSSCAVDMDCATQLGAPATDFGGTLLLGLLLLAAALLVILRR